MAEEMALVKLRALDKAAEYLMQKQSLGDWSQMSEIGRNVYRQQVIEILALCGLRLPGSNGS